MSDEWVAVGEDKEGGVDAGLDAGLDAVAFESGADFEDEGPDDLALKRHWPPHGVNSATSIARWQS